MSSSRKLVGPLEFALSILLVTAGAVGSGRVFAGKTTLRLGSLPPHLITSFSALFSCVFALLAVKTINGRFLDIGLPRKFRQIALGAFAIWMSATLLMSYFDRFWMAGLTLLVILLLTGSLTSHTTVTASSSSLYKIAEEPRKTLSPGRRLPERLHVDPAGFLRSLLTIACIWLPLIWLKGTFHRGFGALVADLAGGILYLISVIKMMGRFADSGRASDWYWFPFCIFVTFASGLPLWFNLLGRYEVLALFMLIQVPLALLPSAPRGARLVVQNEPAKRHKGRTVQGREAKKSIMIGPIAFLLSLVVIACLWALLIYVESASGGGVGVGFSRSGYVVLTCAWVMIATGRFTDADWDHGWRTSQYCLVVAVASLMPFAVHWVNGYGALAIFVLIQIPAVFLKSKPNPEDPVSGGGHLNESRAGAPPS